MRRRTAPPPPLRLEIVDWLLEGQVRHTGPERPEDTYDSFLEFDTPEPDLASMWREHRVGLMAEATRRGIARPWGMQFDQ
jgi:hypothetical protein